jgi:hypothetical protein
MRPVGRAWGPATDFSGAEFVMLIWLIARLLKNGPAADS